MKEKQNLRINVLNYFLTVSQVQKKLEKHQQNLASTNHFNPVTLFDKISTHQPITRSIFQAYLESKLKITDSHRAIKAYFFKHNLHSNHITLQQFLNTIIPHNPAFLRRTYTSLVYSTQSGHSFDKLYLNLVSYEISNILALEQMRKDLHLQWDEVKRTIEKDLKVGILSKKKIEKEENFAVKVRKWMSLIDEHFDEQDILYLVRWVGGTDQASIATLFNNNKITNHSTTSHHKSVQKNQAKILVKPKTHLKLSKSEKNLICTCNHSPENKHIDPHHYYGQVIRKPNSNYQQQQVIRNKNNRVSDNQPYQILIKYIEELISFERKMQKVREQINLVVIEEVMEGLLLNENQHIGIVNLMDGLDVQFDKQKWFKLYKERRFSKRQLQEMLKGRKSKRDTRIIKQERSNKFYSGMIEKLMKLYLEKGEKLGTFAKQLEPDAVEIFQQIVSENGMHNICFISRKNLQQFLHQHYNEILTNFDVDLIMEQFGDGKIITAPSFYRRIQMRSKLDV